MYLINIYYLAVLLTFTSLTNPQQWINRGNTSAFLSKREIKVNQNYKFDTIKTNL